MTSTIAVQGERLNSILKVSSNHSMIALKFLTAFSHLTECMYFTLDAYLRTRLITSKIQEA